MFEPLSDTITPPPSSPPSPHLRINLCPLPPPPPPSGEPKPPPLAPRPLTCRYISALLLSLSTMLHLELPHINLLSKVDLIRQYGKLGA